MGKTRKTRATIYDVADKAGVSITTVSRYLNNPEAVKTSTGGKIAEVMEKLDYRPQGNAGKRADRSVGRIGVITPFFPAPSFVERLEGMMPVFKSHNYEMVIYTIEGTDQLDEYLSSVPFTRRIDGLVLMSVRLTEEQHRNLEASGLHVVVVETDDVNYSRVLADDDQGGRLAAELFLRKDYFPCVYFGDSNTELSYSLHPSELRLKGFRSALLEAGRDESDLILAESDTKVVEARRVFGEILDGPTPPRAVFAMSDLHAIGALKAAGDRSLRIPEDLAILGFDDIEGAEWIGLSTITQHLGDSGRIAAGLLMDRLSGKTRAIQKVNLQVGLVERSTT